MRKQLLKKTAASVLSLAMIVLKFTEKPCDIRIGGENFENYQAKRQGGRF